MFVKLLTVVVFATALAAALLSVRQQRLQAMHEMAQHHRQIDAARQATWDTQVKIAQRLRPGELREALERARLALEPVVPEDLVESGASRRVAEAEHVSR